MAKLSAATKHALSVVAHVTMAHDISQKVDGMKGFREFYMKTLSPADVAVWEHFKALTRQAYKDARNDLERDTKNGR